MIIDIILPYKEIFSSKKASAVSLTIKNSAEFSEYKKNINVFGQETEDPFKQINFFGLKTNKFLHFGNNNSIFLNYLKILNNKNYEKRIIEMHNRPYVCNLAIKKSLRYPITMHFHNDPRTMKGSKSIKERISLAKSAQAILFVSEYIKNCFLDGITNNFDNLYVIPNGIQRTLFKMPTKRKQILFIGRLVHEKGCHLFVKAIQELVLKHQDWKFTIIGTPKAGQDKLNSDYSKKLISDFKLLGPNTEYLGFVKNSEVKKILTTTSILVVPSIWQEPFALTALEGMCSGAAIIASRVGGMGEMLSNTGMLIDNIDEYKLRDALKTMIVNKDILQRYQKNSWNNYQYNQTDIVKKQDLIRNKIFKLHKFNK